MLPFASVGLFLAGMAVDSSRVEIAPPTFVDEWWGFVTDRPRFHQPFAVSAGQDGSLYVIDGSLHRVLRFAADGAFLAEIEVPAPPPPGLPLVTAAAATQDVLYLSDEGARLLHRISPGPRDPRHPQRALDPLPFLATRNGLAADPLGNLYISGWRLPSPGSPNEPGLQEGPAIWRLNRLGEFLDRWDVPAPGPLTVAADGTIYVLTRVFDDGPACLRRLSPLGAILSQWELEGFDHRYPTGVAVDERGHAYFTIREPGIIEIDAEGHRVGRWGGVSPDREALRQAEGVTVDAEGFLYVADWAQSRIVKYDPASPR